MSPGLGQTPTMRLVMPGDELCVSRRPNKRTPREALFLSRSCHFYICTMRVSNGDAGAAPQPQDASGAVGVKDRSGCLGGGQGDAGNANFFPIPGFENKGRRLKARWVGVRETGVAAFTPSPGR